MDIINLNWNLTITSTMVRKAGYYSYSKVYYWLIYADLDSGNQIQIRQKNDSDTAKQAKNNFLRFKRKWKIKYRSD